MQLGLWRHGQRRELDSGKGKARLGRERVEEALVITWGSIPRVGWGGGAAGDEVRRRPGSASAGQPTLLSWPTVEASQCSTKI
jgi:hypothetical protein